MPPASTPRVERFPWEPESVNRANLTTTSPGRGVKSSHRWLSISTVRYSRVGARSILGMTSPCDWSRIRR